MEEQLICSATFQSIRVEKFSRAKDNVTGRFSSLGFCFPPARFQAEVDDTLKRIQEHKGVQGFLIINNDGKTSFRFFSFHFVVHSQEFLFGRISRPIQLNSTPH